MSATHNISHWEEVTVDISEDADLSTAFDARAGSQYGLIVPSNFDGTQILFHGSYDNITYYPIDGTTMTVAASTAYGALPLALSAYPWWKIETVTDQSTSDTVFIVVAKGGAGSGAATLMSPGTGATNLGKAEDAAHASGDVGVMALGVRATAATDRSAGGTDGDYEPFAVDALGAMWIRNVGAATATVTSVNDTAASTTLLSASTSRKGAIFFNDSTSILYIKFGTTASATDFTMKLGPGESGYLTTPVYTGRIDGIWSADASGAARVTELT